MTLNYTKLHCIPWWPPPWPRTLGISVKET